MNIIKQFDKKLETKNKFYFNFQMSLYMPPVKVKLTADNGNQEGGHMFVSFSQNDITEPIFFIISFYLSMNILNKNV